MDGVAFLLPQLKHGLLTDASFGVLTILIPHLFTELAFKNSELSLCDLGWHCGHLFHPLLHVEGQRLQAFGLLHSPLVLQERTAQLKSTTDQRSVVEHQPGGLAD